MTRSIAAIILVAGLAGCTQFPALERAVPAAEQQGPYPPLVPVPLLLAQAEDPRIATGDDAALQARADALRARARRLQQQ